MIYNQITCSTSIECNESLEGETIEQKVERIMSNNEAIEDIAPLIYTDRADGVQPQYDIRTDRFDLAIEAMDYVTKSEIAKRDNVIPTEEKPKSGETPANTSDVSTKK